MESNKEESDQLPEEQPGEAVYEDDAKSEEEKDRKGGTGRGRPEGDEQDDDRATGGGD